MRNSFRMVGYRSIEMPTEILNLSDLLLLDHDTVVPL